MVCCEEVARGEWAEFEREVLALYEAPLRSRRTRASMRLTLRRLGSLGVRSPAELTAAMVARLVGDLAARGFARCTIAGVLRYVSAICGYAVATGRLAASPFAWRGVGRWVRGEPTPPRTRHLSIEELQLLLQACRARARRGWQGQRLNALVVLVAHTGLRRDEALGARVEDVDFQRGLFWVRSHRGVLKTIGSAAPVPLPPEAVRVLRRWVARCGSEWLFPGVRLRGPWLGGSPGSRALDQLQGVAGSVGLVGVTWLALRHSFATHLESRWHWGEAAIARVLRHSVTSTSRHYRHADLANLQEMAAGVDYKAPARRRGDKARGRRG